MADIIDRANDYHEAGWVADQKAWKCYNPEGEPGECGQFNPRLVKGACSRCRDKLRLA